MKKLLTIVTIFITLSCSTRPVEDYHGGVVIEKGKSLEENYFFHIKFQGIVTPRKYFKKYDWDRYSVGDTIRKTKLYKCPI